MTPPATLTSPAQVAALQTLVRANGLMRAELGKLLKTPLSEAERAFWTEYDAARALEAHALQRLLEAGRGA